MFSKSVEFQLGTWVDQVLVVASMEFLDFAFSQSSVCSGGGGGNISSQQYTPIQAYVKSKSDSNPVYRVDIKYRLQIGGSPIHNKWPKTENKIK